SQWPPSDPPQGPFSRDFEQRAMGQIPPVKPSMQSPQAAQRSSQMPCSGKVDPIYILQAFEDGADGVLVAG
ncbi:MAG: hydrogenase iron-sulfur subunit, partial [Anaerolineales bacterium]|nr:hydrogenase iron-sulfur subunit [Anaerolineales bacterium]